jgi:hypothetical protein
MARFYSALLGWEMPYCEDEYSMVKDGATSIGFGRVEGYQPPTWPDDGHAKQYHLDLRVANLAKAEAAAREMGATLRSSNPEGSGGT